MFPISKRNLTSRAGEEEPLCTRLVNKEKGFYFLVGCLGRLLEVKTTAVGVLRYTLRHADALGLDPKREHSEYSMARRAN